MTHPVAMSGWRKNAAALVAVAILVPLAAMIIIGGAVRSDRANRPSDPIVVDYGSTATYAGATLGPVASAFVTDSGAPRDTRVVRAIVPIRNGADLLCSSPKLKETVGERRSWDESSLLLADTDFGWSTLCSPSQGDEYELTLSYLVPADATGPFVIDLFDTVHLPKFVQFELRPDGS